MTIDMRLISVKDGGRFAMSWIAGTNPKALRSNFQSVHIYTVDVPEVCEHIMEAIKSKEYKLSFRILFKLCFGTIHIFSEQVQHLYNVTLNFVCFNTFVLKHYSSNATRFVAIKVDTPYPPARRVILRKKATVRTLTRQLFLLIYPFGDDFFLFRSTLTNKENRERRWGSSDSLDFSSLLMESEIVNEYSEEKFKLPNQIGRSNTSTSIQIKQITIRQISWDSPMPEDEEEFGEATHDDKIMLLSALSDVTVDNVMNLHTSNGKKRKSSFETTDCSPSKKSNGENVMNVQSLDGRKRKSSFEITDCSPLKKSNDISNESIDFIRYAPSVCNDTMSELNVDIRNHPSAEVEIRTSPDYTGKGELDPAQGDLLPENQPTEDHSSVLRTDLDDLQEIPPSKTIPDCYSNEVQNLNAPSESEQKTHSKLPRKRRRPQLIIDRVIKLSKPDTENIWQNCHNYETNEHIAWIEKTSEQRDFKTEIPSRRFQSSKLLVKFKNILKTRLKQDHDILVNRQLILEEILGDKYEIYKKEFKLESKGRCKIDQKKPSRRQEVEVETIEPFVPDENNNCLQSNCFYEEKEIEIEEVVSLKCPIDKIDPYAISFDFPLDAGKQRSEWGRDGILIKLLLAWKSKGSNINMSSIIVGANRINAALAFHTLLDLAGQQYVEIIKDNNNSIDSIKMGPEMIRKINEKCS